MPLVPVLSNVLRAHHNGKRVRALVKQTLCKVDCNDTRTAAHTAQIVVEHITTHLVLIDNHGGERRRGAEQRTIRDNKVNLVRFDTRALEHLVQTGIHYQLGFLSCSFHGERKIIHCCEQVKTNPYGTRTRTRPGGK